MLHFTFPAGKQANILLPVSYADTTVFASHVRYVDSQTITGDVSSQIFLGPASPNKVYFAIKLSKPLASHGVWTGATMSDGIDSASRDSQSAPVIGLYGSYPASEISTEALSALKPQGNVLAVHVRHPGAGRHGADVAIMDIGWPEAER